MVKKCDIKTVVSRMIICFVFALLFMNCVEFFYPVHYEVNDDLGLENFLSNGFDAVFMTVLAGKLVKGLYSINPFVGFYPLFLFFVHSLSLTAVFYCVVSLFNNASRIIKVELLLFLCLILVFYAKALIALTFTTTAFLVGFSGVVLFCVFLVRHSDSLIELLLPGLLFGLSYLVRPDSAKGVLVFALPVLLLALLYYAKNHLYRMLVPALCFLSPVLVLICAEQVVYEFATTNEYKDFVEFNAVRGKIHGFPVVRKLKNNQELLAINGWSANDCAMFRNWFFAHEDKFNQQTVANVFAFIPTTSLFEKVKKLSLLSTQRFFSQLWKKHTLLCVLSIICFFACIYKQRNVVLLVFFLFYFAYVFSGMLVLSEFWRLPSRIAAPILLGISFLVFCFSEAFYATWGKKESVVRGLLSIGVCGVFLSLIYLQFDELAELKATTLERRANLKSEISFLNEKLNGCVFFSKAGKGIDFTSKNPFRPGDYKLTFDIVGGGWSTYSPFFYKQLNYALGIDQAKELLPALIDNPDAFVKVNPNGRFMFMLKMFVLETYGVEIELVGSPWTNLNHFVSCEL